MYVCVRCKEVYPEYPSGDKCRICSSRIFYKKREPIVKKVKAV